MGRGPGLRAERRKGVAPRSRGPPGGRRRGRRLRPAHPGRRRRKRACSRRTSPSPRPGTATSSSIPTARPRRPWSSSPASTGPSSGRSGPLPTTGRPGKGCARTPSAASSIPFAPRCRPASRPSPRPVSPARPPSAWPSSSPGPRRALQRAERTALLRQLQAFSGRSKVGRVMSQLGHHGRQVWTNLEARRKAASQSAEASPAIRSRMGRPDAGPGSRS